MRKIVLTAAALLLLNSQSFAAINIDTVPVGNAGNANDPNTGSTYGGVSYNYSIGKYDVTLGQYTAFLNAVARTDTYGLYNPNMATNLNSAGISQSGSSGNYTYSVIGSANHPVTYVSWGDAARFTNWLANGQPTGAEGNATTETGSYMLNGATSEPDLNAVTRSANATWVIPTENEWYKAAYYDPVAGHYWNYATGTNTIPTSSPPSNTPNSANYLGVATGYAVTGSKSYDVNQNYLTDVGAYTTSASPYGTFDQCGDVFQWTEAESNDFYRILRGSAWDPPFVAPSSTERNFVNPIGEFSDTGFRLALVPEPASYSLALLALGGFVAWAAKRII